MAPLTARIRWNERVAQLQTGNGFSSWLVAELASGDLAPEESQAGDVTDRYSTHPSLRDRLAALPPDERMLEESPPAMHLLVSPDAVAGKLVEEIHRIAAAEEARDSAERRRWVHRLGRSGNLLPIQVFGAALAGCGLLITAFSWKTYFSAWELVCGALVLAGGGGLVRMGRYRDKRPLPIPEFAAVKAAAERTEDTETRKAREKELEAELRKRVSKLLGRRRSALLVDEAYGALERCDYLAAHVAARLCLEFDKRNVEARLALAVAWSAFRNIQNANGAMKTITKATGLHTPSAVWAAGWGYMLLGDWLTAESFLLEAMRLLPGQPRLAAFAASCQLRRGKLQSGVAHAKIALQASPSDPQLRKLLASLLIGAGFLREAQDVLASRPPGGPGDPEFEVLAIRLLLLQGSLEAAHQRTDELFSKATTADIDIRLGEAYEASRDDGRAISFFERALVKGHYPEARLGLARLLAHRDESSAARVHLLAAITAGRQVGERSLPYWQVFRLALRQLALLEKPVSGAEAWQATIAGNAEFGILANQTFLVFAVDQGGAERYLRTVTNAVLTGKPPLQPTAIRWRAAERDRQPAGAVRPGVQAYWRE
jgi:tetratricopeptide (TPR) repeat protein